MAKKSKRTARGGEEKDNKNNHHKENRKLNSILFTKKSKDKTIHFL